MVHPKSSGGLVYSTEVGRMCPDCRQALAQCACRQHQPLPATDGVVRVSRVTKGRGGKAVTLIKGLALDATALTLLGKQLKAACGSGGTVKDGVIEIQGEHCERVIERLKAQGHSVKRALAVNVAPLVANDHTSVVRKADCGMNPDHLQLLLVREMPFGKYKGHLIADLPGNYLNWFAREGFPPGEIGRLLALMHEIDHNGLGFLLDPLRRNQARRPG